MTSKPSVRRCIERKAWASGGIEASACLAARVFPIGWTHHICNANHPKFAKAEASPKFMSCGISSILDDYSTNRERWRLSPGSVPAAGVSTRYFSPSWICLNSGRAAWCKASVETVQVLFFEGHLALRLARVDRLDPKLLMFLWITGFAPAFFIIAVPLAL